MAQIALRIQIPATSTTKVIKFDARMGVHEAIQTIHDKTGQPKDVEHGLFLAHDDGTGKWLKPDKTLVFYDLKANDTLEFRRKHRPLKVKLMDDSTKMIKADESAPVSEVVKQIAKKIGLANPEEFSLQEEGASESDWLNANLSLHEQKVNPSSVLLLKKKYFFSDANIDTNDPVELHLLYVQAVKQIITETHRCSLEEAIKLGALMMQIIHGNHNPNKHKPGTLKLDDLIPPSFVKAKGIDKELIGEHRKLTGLSEVHAKYRYLQLVRSLKTYGITFFNVKEKAKGKNKPVPRLLGVTRDSIMRMDAQTKAVISHFPLTHLRRWAVNPGTLTLDFGDYEEAYITFMVDGNDGDAASQLIAGYIDIILQKRREADAGAKNYGDQELVASEEMVGPARAQPMQMVGPDGQPMQAGYMGEMGGMTAGMSGMAQEGMMGYGQAQAVLGEMDSLLESLNNQSANLSGYHTGDSELEAAYSSVVNAAAELAGTPGDTAAFMHDYDPESAQAQMAQFGQAVAAAAAALCNADSPEAMMLAAQQMAAACSQLVAAAKAASPAIGAKDPAAQQRLIEAARLVAMATAKLVGAAGDRDAMVAAAREIAAATAALLSAGDGKSAGALQGGAGMNQQAQSLINATQSVADACTRLMATAKTTAQTAPPEECEKVVAAAKTTAGATERLVSAAKVAADRIAMGINDPAAQAELVAAAKGLGASVAGLVSTTQSAANASGKADPAHQQLLAFAAKSVADAIAQLVAAAKIAAASVPTNLARDEFQAASKEIDEANNRLLAQFGPGGSQAGLLSAAKDVSSATSRLVTSARSAANRTMDPERKDALMNGAKSVGDSTGGLVGAVKTAAPNMNDPNAQNNVRNAVMQVRAATDALLQRQLRDDLIDASKEFADAQTNLIASSKNASKTASPAAQTQFVSQAKPMADAITNMMNAKKAPDGPSFLPQLVVAAKAATGAGNNLVDAARGVCQTATDRGAANQLDGSITAARDATDKLMAAAKAAGSDQKDLDDIISSTNNVGANVAGLVASARGNQTEFMDSAKRSAATAGDLVNLVTERSAGVMDQDLREQLLAAAKAVAVAVTQLVPRAKEVQNDKTNSDSQQQLSSAAKGASQSIAFLSQSAKTAFAPTQPSRAVAAANDTVLTAADVAAVTAAPIEGDGSEDSRAIALAAAQVAAGAARVAIGRENPNEVTAGSKQVDTASASLDSAVNKQATSASNPILRSQLLSAARSVNTSAKDLVAAARNPNDPFSSEKVGNSSKEVMGSTHKVVAASKLVAAINPLEKVLKDHAPGADAPEYHKKVVAAATSLNAGIEKVANCKSQGDLIAAAKDVATYSSALTSAAKDGASITTDTTAQQQLLDTAKAVTDGTAALITSAKKSLADPSGKSQVGHAARSLQIAAAQVSNAADAACANSVADTMAAQAKSLLTNTVAVVANDADQAEVMASSKTLASSAARLGVSARQMATITVDEGVQNDLFESAQKLTDQVSEMNTLARTNLSDAQANQKLQNSAVSLVDATSKIVMAGRAASALLDGGDGDDEAENELIAASKAIEEISNSILSVPDDGNVLGEKESQVAATIVSFCKAITQACGKLCVAARANQREINAMRKAQPSNTFYSKDPSVLEGLIASSRAIVGGCSMLVDASNENVQGQDSETKMIASAQSVAASTAQLVAASKVKSKPGSKNQEKLQAASRAVTQAVNTLVRAAKQASERKEEAQAAAINPSSYAEAQRAEIEAKMKVLELEKQLAAARGQVHQMHREKYTGAGVSDKPAGAPPKPPQ